MRHDRDAILARVDLEALADEILGPRARPAIRMWPCPNPDHHQTGRTPPLSVFAARSGHQRWHCHGCGDGGTAIDLLLATRHAHDVRDALDWLAHRAGLTPDSPPSGRAHALRAVAPSARRPPSTPCAVDERTVEQLDAYASACAEHLHSRDGREVRAWLTEQRAIPSEVIEAAGLGADPGPRRLSRPDGVPRVFPAVVFPVRQDGHVVYTVSRHLRPVASRWWNTAERVAPNPRLAFYDPPAQAARGIVVTEGPIDALSALAAGYQAAAILGAGTITPALADGLAAPGQRLLLALDNDTEGRRAHEHLASMLTDRRAPWSALPIPGHYSDLNEWHTVSRARWPSVVRCSDHLSCSIKWPSVPPPGVA
jgi:DNA primase